MLLKRKQTLTLFLAFVAIIAGVLLYIEFRTEKPKVVVVLKEVNFEFWEILKLGVEKGFEDFGIQGEVLTLKNGTSQEQKEILAKVLKEEPDALIVSPVNLDIIPILEEFKEKGIPVMFIQTNLSWDHKTSYIGTDNHDLGVKAGELVASQLHPGDKVILIGRTWNVEGERMEGAKSSLETVGMNIVMKRLFMEEFEDGTIEHIIEDVLKEHPDLDGIFTTSDYVAIPVLKVLQEQSIDIPVTGTDGLPEILDLIDNGRLSMGIAQNPYDMGYLSVETSVKAIQGEKVYSFVNSGVDFLTPTNVKERMEFLDKVLK